MTNIGPVSYVMLFYGQFYIIMGCWRCGGGSNDCHFIDKNMLYYGEDGGGGAQISAIFSALQMDTTTCSSLVHFNLILVWTTKAQYLLAQFFN